MIEIATRESFNELYPHTDEGYNYFRVNGVYFAASKRGEAVNIHIASERKNKTKLRKSVNEFVSFVFKHFEWCNMILATIAHDKKSVKNLAKNCGFEWVADSNECSIYARLKP